MLKLIVDGLSSSQAAKVLGVSERTINSHRDKISLKTGISDIAGLTKYAIREGLTTVDV